eukprot:5646038-Pyramimonas_sp.AAC.2
MCRELTRKGSGTGGAGVARAREQCHLQSAQRHAAGGERGASHDRPPRAPRRGGYQHPPVRPFPPPLTPAT